MNIICVNKQTNSRLVVMAPPLLDLVAEIVQVPHHFTPSTTIIDQMNRLNTLFGLTRGLS